MKSIETSPETTITVTTGGQQTTFPLYGEDAGEYLSALWLKHAAQQKLMYEVKWMGVPFIQMAEDLAMMHELVWTLRPDAIVECGIGQGGGLVFYSSMLELLGAGKVVGVEIEIRQPTHERIDASPFRNRIELVEGDSSSPVVVDQVKELIAGSRTVLVILDSDHTATHVARESSAYHSLVTSGSYLVVMDGAAAHVWDIPRDQRKYKNNHPLMAIDEFLATHPEFQEDPHYNRLGITSSPRGFLKKL